MSSELINGIGIAERAGFTLDNISLALTTDRDNANYALALMNRAQDEMDEVHLESASRLLRAILARAP